MKDSENTGPGRPPTDNPMEMHCVRTLREEWALWKQAAELRGMKRSEYIRQVMNRSAKRTISGQED